MRNDLKTIPNGFILWEGLSDSVWITVIIVGLVKPSTNRKTGAMLQSYIILRDMNPLEAIRLEKDSAICGNCPLRPSKNNICYLDHSKETGQIYRSLKRGNYPHLDEFDYEGGNLILDYISQNKRHPKGGFNLRVGSYGDPIFTDRKTWEPLFNACKRWTGYTHQAFLEDGSENPLALPWKGKLMASVQDVNGYLAAQLHGWPTFRLKSPEDPLFKGEIICPFDETNPQLVKCNWCLKCHGSGLNIAVDIHGVGFKHKNYVNYQQEVRDSFDKYQDRQELLELEAIYNS